MYQRSSSLSSTCLSARRYCEDCWGRKYIIALTGIEPSCCNTELSCKIYLLVWQNHYEVINQELFGFESWSLRGYSMPSIVIMAKVHGWRYYLPQDRPFSYYFAKWPHYQFAFQIFVLTLYISVLYQSWSQEIILSVSSSQWKYV